MREVKSRWWKKGRKKEGKGEMERKGGGGEPRGEGQSEPKQGKRKYHSMGKKLKNKNGERFFSRKRQGPGRKELRNLVLFDQSGLLQAGKCCFGHRQGGSTQTGSRDSLLCPSHRSNHWSLKE